MSAFRKTVSLGDKTVETEVEFESDEALLFWLLLTETKLNTDTPDDTRG